MNMEFLNDLIEYMSLKREVGNSCLHSLEDRLVPAAYAIHRIVSKFITNCQNRSQYFLHHTKSGLSLAGSEERSLPRLVTY